MGRLGVIKSKIPYTIRLNIYKSLAESLIFYGLTSYGRTFNTYLDRIYALQLRILKMLVPPKIKEQFKDDTEGLFQHCKVLPVHSNVHYALLKENFFNLDLQQTVSHPISTRKITNKKLILPPITNFYGKRTTKYLIPKLINQIPTDIRNGINNMNLKETLKKLFSHQ
ncbi:hypothetical protein JYU34_001502 [Plutella xylostella]|uniref:Uncharacterized protein n=1 Tax=Plutella xylostella TaxID=51655 RepID=A0ABQ7R440_PLUXY|nr:hypothetical protein JYU34_001502 [Plutella xylostella]